MSNKLKRILAWDPRYKGPSKGLLTTIWVLSLASLVALFLCIENGHNTHNKELSDGQQVGAEIWAFIFLAVSIWTAIPASIVALILLQSEVVPTSARVRGMIVASFSWMCILFLFWKLG